MKDSINEVIKVTPELKNIYDRVLEINQIRADAVQKQNQELKADMLESCLREVDMVYAEAIQLVSNKSSQNFKLLMEAYNTMKQTAEDYNNALDECKNALQEERNANRETFDNLCAAFLVNPRGAFEVVLNFIERDEKIKCSDGRENLTWTLKFSLFKRIQMAAKLIFK